MTICAKKNNCLKTKNSINIYHSIAFFPMMRLCYLVKKDKYSTHLTYPFRIFECDFDSGSVYGGSFSSLLNQLSFDSNIISRKKGR